MGSLKAKSVIRQQGRRKSPGLAGTAARVLSPSGKPLPAARLSPKVLGDLPPEIRPILTMSYNALNESRTANRRVRFVVDIGPRGAPEIIPIEGDAKDQREKNDLDAALAAARSRGGVVVAEILNRDEMLNDEKFGKLIGVSRTTVNTKRKKQQILGLEGAKRGVRFPAWQIGEDGKPFAGLPQLFDRLGGNPWTVYRFLVQHHPELDGLTGCEALQRGQTDKVISVAETVARASS
jgi:hypothetical protein